MARATDSDVRALVVTLAAGDDTAPFIATASVVADDLLSASGLSEDVLTQIEIFLAAHFAVLAVEKGGMRKETVGESSESYQTISERFKGFYLTRFGQQAVAMDTTGTLAAQGSASQKSQLRVVGSTSNISFTRKVV